MTSLWRYQHSSPVVGDIFEVEDKGEDEVEARSFRLLVSTRTSPRALAPILSSPLECTTIRTLQDLVEASLTLMSQHMAYLVSKRVFKVIKVIVGGLAMIEDILR